MVVSQELKTGCSNLAVANVFLFFFFLFLKLLLLSLLFLKLGPLLWQVANRHFYKEQKRTFPAHTKACLCVVAKANVYVTVTFTNRSSPFRNPPPLYLNCKYSVHLPDTNLFCSFDINEYCTGVFLVFILDPFLAPRSECYFDSAV